MAWRYKALAFFGLHPWTSFNCGAARPFDPINVMTKILLEKNSGSGQGMPARKMRM